MALSLSALILYCSSLVQSAPNPIPAIAESRSGLGPMARNASASTGEMSEANDTKSLTVSKDCSVPVGQVISSCTVSGVVALTFDDGPSIYTSQVLDTLSKNGVPATFFVNGDNWSDIESDDDQALVKRMIDEGHQIGSHTYSHANLTTLSHGNIAVEMNRLSTALVSIIGKTPTYMRPPYFSTDSRVLSVLGDMGYHVIEADIDTLDWQNDGEDAIRTSVQRFKDGLDAGGSIELSHDVYERTADTLVQAMIDEINERGLKAVTVGDCLGDPESNWYSN